MPMSLFTDATVKSQMKACEKASGFSSFRKYMKASQNAQHAMTNIWTPRAIRRVRGVVPSIAFRLYAIPSGPAIITIQYMVCPASVSRSVSTNCE